MQESWKSITRERPEGLALRGFAKPLDVEPYFQDTTIARFARRVLRRTRSIATTVYWKY